MDQAHRAAAPGLPLARHGSMRAIVVGAGVLGASAAYHLARAGAQVALVDRADQGRATAAGAGIVAPWGSHIDDPAAYALLEGGARYYATLVALLAEDGQSELGFSRVGALYVPDDPGELGPLEARIRARAGDAPEVGHVERVTPAQARALFPPLREDLAGLHVSGGARVNGRLLAAALRRGAERHGARVIDGSAELTMRGGRAAGVSVAGEAIEADVVVAAAGAWGSALLAPAGRRLAVQPQRGQIVHFRQPGTETRHWPAVLPMTSYYMLAFDDSRVVVGASRESGAGFDYRLTAAGVAGVLAAALHTAPGLAEWTIEEIRIGFRPLADDARPMLGPAPGIDGLLIANGLGPSGLAMGPYAGALMAQLALGETPALDLSAFSPARGATSQAAAAPAR